MIFWKKNFVLLTIKYLFQTIIKYSVKKDTFEINLKIKVEFNSYSLYFWGKKYKIKALWVKIFLISIDVEFTGFTLKGQVEGN